MSIKQAIEALEELIEYAETAGFDWSLDNARAALAALRSMPQGEPVKQGNADEKESRAWPVDPHSQEDGGHDASGACTQGGTGKVQCDQHRAGDADAERENDQRASRGDGVRGACDVSPPVPYGQVTTHSVTGQHFFFRWPQPPYLDTASECVTVYTQPHTEAVRMSEAEIIDIAKNPMTAPCSPWWLKDDVVLGDVRNAAIVFARAVEQATAARLGVKMGDATQPGQQPDTSGTAPRPPRA